MFYVQMRCTVLPIANLSYSKVGADYRLALHFKNMVVLGTANGYYGIDKISGVITLPLQTHVTGTGYWQI